MLSSVYKNKSDAKYPTSTPFYWHKFGNGNIVLQNQAKSEVVIIMVSIA